MAIFGSLSDMPLTDLMPMLGRRSGVLEVWNLEGHKSVSLWLETGLLRGAWLNGKNLDTQAARGMLLEVMKSNQGDFEFMMGQPTLPCEHLLDWALEQVLDQSVLRENSLNFAQLPDPETKFQAITLEIWLEEPLFGFWTRAKPLLESGASASQIAQRLGVPLDKVQLYLHKLRVAGRIGPVRAYELQPTSEERKGLVSRLLEALFRRRS